MARIAFAQNILFEYLGLMYISSWLKSNGHECEMFIKLGSDESLAKDIIRYSPQVVAFPCLTGSHSWCLSLAKILKEKNPKLMTLFGGPHPTFYPGIINEPEVDVICRGEGEYALLDLANSLDKKENPSLTANLWVKDIDVVTQNEVRPLIPDLDKMPFPDRQLYYRKYPFLNISRKTFLTSRGCPYKCSFCFNHILQKIYQSKGTYLRRRTVKNVIEEINGVKRKYGLRTVYFQDDTFVLSRDWVMAFLEVYKKEVNLPFICLIRADLTDEKLIGALKGAGCVKVYFGIESGDRELRNSLLQKNITDEMIIQTAGWLKKYRIGFRTYNMIGLPGETLNQAFKTVDLNVRIKTDYPWCSVYQPYPETELGAYALEQGMLNCSCDKIRPSFFKDSILRSPWKKELLNLQKLFFYAVKFPRLKNLIKKAITFPPNFLFDLLFLCGNACAYAGSERLRLNEFFLFGFYNLKNFFTQIKND
jgi:radical SAM superfamily enzyme YgiQ (UPF0313 family)